MPATCNLMGASAIRQVLERAPLFASVPGAAAAAERVGRVRGFSSGDVLIQQGAPGSSIFVVIRGEVDIRVDGQLMARRPAGAHVGEMAVIDPRHLRSATVSARGDVVALELGGAGLMRLLRDHPLVWHNIACELAVRLRQRDEFVRPANALPRLFVGSSREALPTAERLSKSLGRRGVGVVPWTHAFRPARYTVADLLDQVRACDFAAFVFAPDDVTVSRTRRRVSPRDNVVYELGLFMGALGHERVFVLHDSDSAPKIPSDLNGITLVAYSSTQTSPGRADVQRIAARIFELGVRPMDRVAKR